jgi:RNA polymerase sigma-70 factor (ECF subfamily)
MAQASRDLSALFDRMRRGEPGARDDVAAALYRDLRKLAASRMRSEAGAHTLQPTALVNEVYLRLADGPGMINGRSHFFALASNAMRHVLVDYARQKRAAKRGGGGVRVTIGDFESAGQIDIDALALDEALTELARLDARAARVVELRFFGGHTDREVCDILGENLPRVRRDWQFARAWLRSRLRPVPAS